MKRLTVLKRTACDVRTLPLGAREAFFLSQLDGQLTLEEITEIAGLDLDEASKLAERLVELGAVTTLESRPPVSTRRGAFTEQKGTPRFDPRAERQSIQPGTQKKRTSSPPDSRVEKVSLKPAPAARRPTPRPEKRRSRKSMRGMPAAIAKPRDVDEKCELEETVQAAIFALDLKVMKSDFYAALDLERTADKKTIKRAYFAFAAKYHPDRFFGKKLGPARIAIERIFHRLTEANNTLTDAGLRAMYDAGLPPLPAPPKEAPPRRQSKAAMRTSSRQMKAAKPVSTPPSSPPSKAPKSANDLVTTARLSKFEPPLSAITFKAFDEQGETSPLVVSDPNASSAPPLSVKSGDASVPSSGPMSSPMSSPASSVGDRTRQLRAAAMEIKLQSTIENLVKAAEAAVQSGDLSGAANNYRLALSHRDDPYLRMKFEDLDTRARIVRFEKNIGPAKAAERDQRWADAALFLVRANEARPDADVAARAANALRLSAGDLPKAATLAEQAVSLDSRNIGYRIVLCEVYLSQNRVSRAQDVLHDALDLAPKDARLKELAALVATQKSKSKSKDW